MPLIEEVKCSTLASSILLIVNNPGKSDPYAVFSLNGDKVYKSQVKKKTLSPEWNETFDVEVVCLCVVSFLFPQDVMYGSHLGSDQTLK